MILSSYQNPEGTLRDRYSHRPETRLKMIYWKRIKDMTVLDIGCNNGRFVREALKHGAKRAVGVDKTDCILGARQLGEGEYWQVDVESLEFKRFCPRFDVVFLFAMLTHLKDPEAFLDWLDGIIKYTLYFESNRGEKYKKHIELVKKHIYFKDVHYIGLSGTPEKPYYMWCCRKHNHELKYPRISNAPIAFIPINRMFAGSFHWGETFEMNEKRVLDQKNTYSLDSEKFMRLKEDIKKRGIRDPIIVQKRKDGDYNIFQGGHRYLIAKQLGYKNVPCKIL